MPSPTGAFLLTSMLFATLAACGQKGPPPSPDGPPGTYHYVLQLSPGGPRAGTLVVDGKDAGAVTEGSGAVQLPHTEWLGEKRLGLRVETTCGPEEVPLELTLSRPAEIDRRKRSTALDGARGAGSFVVKAQERPAAIVYLDARTGGPAKVTLGKQVVDVTRSQKITVQVGSCSEARTIQVGGGAVGELSPAGKATLVDVPGGQCARLEAVRYAVAGMSSRGADGAQVLKGRRTYEVPLEITYFFLPPPSTIEGRKEVGTTLWALGNCP